ncbi:MAG: pitrilysin family protein [bacterium]
MSFTKGSSGSSSYRKTTLPNGLRVISERIPSVRSISLGVWVDVGVRHETSGLNGVSHLIEHMVFKGTRRRNARQIAASLESIGGNLNAFTSREQTCYTARVLDEHLETSVDVLADLTGNATFTPTNLKREKLVICEEIREAEENPSDRIHDLFAEVFWGKHPLGQPILGSLQTVNDMPRRSILSFLNHHYRTESVVLAASGSVSHQKLVRLARERFRFEEGCSDGLSPAAYPTQSHLVAKANDTEQIHTCIGFPGLAYNDPDRIPLLLLTMHLGSGMSSALFQAVRETFGLAYTIYSFHDSFRDAGIFGTYFATDQKNLPRALALTMKELRRVRTRHLSSQRLEQVKRQFMGQLVLGMESTAARMSRMARCELMLGRYITMRQTMNAIERTTADDVRDVAQRVIDEKLVAIATLGPVDKSVLESSL